MRFQSETSVFKFLRRSVEGPKGACLHTRGRIIHGVVNNDARVILRRKLNGATTR